MRLVSFLISFLLLLQNFASCEVLFENPVEFSIETGCEFSEFCEKYIDDIDVEKFIEREMKNEYVPVSLDECLDVALKNNFNIAINEHEYKSSKYDYEYSLTKFLPIFNTTSYITDYSGQILVGGVLRDTFHETAISVNITAMHRLTEGGKQIFEAKAKRYFSRAKRHDLNFTKSQVLYYTTKYYYEMLLAKLSIEIYLRNLIERNAQLSLAKKLQTSGFGTRFDVVRSENEAALAKVKLLNALNDFRLSQTRLANLMGIKVETALMPFESDIEPLHLVDKEVKLDELYELALDNREDLKSYRDLISYEKAIKNVYVTDFFPKPLFQYEQQYQGTINHSILPNYIIAGYLTWEPGENLALGTLAKIKMQKEKIRVRSLEFQNQLRNIQQALTEAMSTTIFNRKEMDITKKRVEYANESIKLAMLRFNNGKGILLDVIQAQSEMTQARVEYVSAIIKYNISQTELLYNSGTINKEILVANYKP